ncbi:MAG: chromosome segregation protein SMC [Phycisphaerales bacterium JB065]
MRLSRITLNGFKSFADRTEFTFDAPVTGVVGPNGCGKSNIVDAIKWVLGERSAKSLRGKEMADVIFAGSSGRKPSGMASVSLSFENPMLDGAQAELFEAAEQVRAMSAALQNTTAEEQSEDVEADDPAQVDEAAQSIGIDRRRRTRYLPIDAEVVEVERRLYRDGKSQYLINGRTARLKDIRELFMDTGVGADAYSIIEQGRVDAMLLANPVERRTFFEEAAGIARFKARRIEAQRKLERTETNLVRTREQLESTERRLRIVKGQAAKARKFMELDVEFKARRLALAFEQYDDLRQRLDGLTSRLQALEKERKAAIAEVSELEDDKQNKEIERSKLHRQREERERELTSATHLAQSAAQRKSMAERSLEEARQQIEADQHRMAELASDIERLTNEAEQQASLAATLAETVKESEEELQSVAEERERLQSELSDQRLKLSERRSAVANIDRERGSLNARLDADRRRIAQHQEQLDALERRAAAFADERTQVESDREALTAEVAKRRSVVEQLEKAISSAVSSATSLSEDQRSLATTLSETEQRLARLDSRRTTLAEMATARVGLGEAVRQLLERRDAIRAGEAPESHESVLEHIIDPLADLIEVDAEDAVAVEAALGSTLQALVVDRAYSLAECTDLSALPGRVTFLPVRDDDPSEIRNTDAADLLANTPGHVVPLFDRIRCDQRVSSSLARVLGSTYLVKDLDAAILLNAGPLAGARFVTRAGEILEPDGRVIAGPLGTGADSDEGSGLLQRASELSTLTEQVTSLQQEIESRRSELRSIDEAAAQLERRLSELRSQQAVEQRALIADESRIERLSADLERLDREQPKLQAESDQCRGKIEDLHAEQRELREKLDSLDRLHGEQAGVVNEIERSVEASQTALDQINEKLTAVRVALGQQSEKLSTAQREHRRLLAQSEEAQRQRGRVEESHTLRLAKIDEHEEVIRSAASEMEEASARTAELESGLSGIREQIEQASQAVREAATVLDEARQRAGRIDRDWNSLELSKRELEVRRENIEERTAEELLIDVAMEYHEYREMMSGGDVERIDVEETSKEINELRSAIKKLGNVNIDSIKEEDELAGRNEQLIQQVEDIDRARTQLEELILRLNDVSRDRFKEVFETIQGHFSGNDGMFRRLFGGGSAQVRLIPDPETGEIDWLESGVEVMAKPPGKEPRSISQLSGGEKTMTAVALLLSIFHSKPSPFCILDEVDAALDDANVERFSKIIRQFLEHCHFIVITHNKRTMQIADQLFGVTMQERGVSTRVSVRFEDVHSDGSIKDSAVKRANAELEAKPAAIEDEEPDQKPASSDKLRRALAESAVNN